MRTPNVLDLFSGIGGFSVGLEAAGMRTVAFCECEPFCKAVLKKHWPEVPIYDDVQSLTADRLTSDGIRVDVICGGFPCQDISFAGAGEGLTGKRSGLWYEFHRLIEEIKPRYAVIENVSALRFRGLDAVLGSLAQIGYDAEWHCIPASAVGAPHRRDRIWIVAYPASQRVEGRRANWEQKPQVPLTKEVLGCHRTECRAANWEIEPAVGRVADGVPARTHRLKALGNAVVPQIPKMIGRAIMEHYR
jgi:DNA (cytosine-5)-methyltransferase 1